MIVLRRVVGGSMLPGLRPGQVVVGVRQYRLLLFWVRFFARPGRIVIIQHGGLKKVKRISKLEGKRVYVLGDNPAASTDSRHFGWLSVDDIRAVVVWPLSGTTSHRRG